MKFCSQCGFERKGDMHFCPNCGIKFITQATDQATIYCAKCGKENSSDSTFCGYCGNSFSPVAESPTVHTVHQTPSLNLPVQQSIVPPFPYGFNFKKYCANCKAEMGVLSRTKIAGEMYICDKCLVKCSKLIRPYFKQKTVQEIRNDILRMNQYPYFTATHQYGRLMFDYNNKLWRSPGYPVYKFSEIIDYDIVEERDVQSKSYSTQTTKTKGGLGRSLVGGALFGAPGAIVGGITAKRKAVSIANTTTNNLEFFTQLGIRIMLNDLNTPSITIDFLDVKTPVSRCKKIVEDINNAAGFLNIVLKNET